MQHRDPVGEAEHHLHVVLDQQHRHPRSARKPRQRFDGLCRLLDRETLRRLVEQEHAAAAGPWPSRPRAGAGRRARAGRPADRRCREAELLERRVGAAPARLGEDRGAAERLPASRMARLGGEPRILARRHLGKQRGQLERARHAALADRRGAGRPVIVLAGEAHAARARLDHAGDEMEQRRLAGAVGSDDGAHLALLDLHATRCRRRRARRSARVRPSSSSSASAQVRLGRRCRRARTQPPSPGPRCPPAQTGRRR